MMIDMCLSITSEGEGLAAASAALDTMGSYAINRSTAKAVRFYQQHQVFRKLKTALAVARFIAIKPQSDF